jgi:hypothetical protein
MARQAQSRFLLLAKKHVHVNHNCFISWSFCVTIEKKTFRLLREIGTKRACQIKHMVGCIMPQMITADLLNKYLNILLKVSITVNYSMCDWPDMLLSRIFSCQCGEPYLK